VVTTGVKAIMPLMVGGGGELRMGFKRGGAYISVREVREGAKARRRNPKGKAQTRVAAMARRPGGPAGQCGGLGRRDGPAQRTGPARPESKESLRNQN
jgi:hypothetical protein